MVFLLQIFTSNRSDALMRLTGYDNISIFLLLNQWITLFSNSQPGWPKLLLLLYNQPLSMQ